MSEWKLATTEQKAWLEAKGDYACPFARFWWGREGIGSLLMREKGWDGFFDGEIRLRESIDLKLCCKITDPELAKAEGFPMGEAVTESLTMRMASDRAEQAEQEQASAVAENPWVCEGFDLKSSQIKSMYDIQNEQAQAQAEAEWQKERRAAWVQFAKTSMRSTQEEEGVGLNDKEVMGISRDADVLLAEFDKRFGEGK